MVNNHYPVFLAIFGTVTPNRTNKQPGDPSASLLLTNVRRQSFAIFGRGSGTIYQKINLSTGWASYFCVTPLFETFWSGSLNWARFPLLSYSSPLLSPFLSSPLNWALFWAKLLNWALFWANPLVWALFWALKRVNLLSRALFWVVLLFWALFWALKKALKLRHNLYAFNKQWCA